MTTTLCERSILICFSRSTGLTCFLGIMSTDELVISLICLPLDLLLGADDGYS